ncbi:MAG: NADH:ubiquinone reductase (Na(+)-transporting) subunit F [Opitutus sp.]|nr:NADH:ubiquinone reductase (Na(+)-transporting) subunit F [Opitutus sp.]MCS6248502.1 NADH:ubiquinone reductase (Na(+)-transporting) subunit F [Opitutus sp.]MCS6275272.1 NADH:ubiquinone reductase (Na(+)-transporting) subunit F [Opitutus sp.]MCS6278367.1 NADH:ubiquinone reductase (Na(+)-transporting) subunit F [Opitutus sp.]MCS6299477.1 NADH:ubiquinone reductase (Na(+)-transporting) subunit F [Opitutus sp.]
MSDHAVLPVPTKLDYSLTGESATRAIERGLAEAEWYQCPIPRETMRKLLERRDGPALRDTLLWFVLILGSAYATYALWGSWWAALPYAFYAVLYASTSDSRWHEAGHGTAFKTDWMNNVLYEIASFMVMRESTVWRWSHTRHHSDTIIVGRDPEIAVPRPPDLKALLLGFFNVNVYPCYFKKIFRHASGRMSADEKTYIPETEFSKIYLKARVSVAIYATAIATAIVTRSILPLLFVGLANIFGSWLMVVYGLTQHTGLAENVLDHRLNCRTVYMNFIHRYLYWNMNYHVEHHMFPLVPYHNLPQLHAAVKDDCPTPYPSLFSAWREIIPSVLRQVKDPAYHVKRVLPAPKSRAASNSPLPAPRSPLPDAQGWIEVCAAADLGPSDVIRFDHGKKTYALYRDDERKLYATDGICTHGNTHLADGLVKGKIVECPKHNGRFNLADGSPARAPVCRGLATYPLEERSGRLWLNVAHSGGSGARSEKTYHLRVVSNRNVATFIKELVLEPIDTSEKIAFTPGDYLQLDIPAYAEIRFADFDIPEPYASVWRTQHVFDLVAKNPEAVRRNNYSLASNQASERVLRFNVRIATPPPGQACPPGVGSAYVFSLKSGDTVTAIGPFGDFHPKPTQREMVYIGGGAGMAPLRAHLSQLFETEHTARRVSFWYGARSKQEIFYEDYFQTIAAAHPNFAFHLALSSPLPEDAWTGHTGFIHDVVLEKYLRAHANPKAVEYYLCGPPMMIKACVKVLTDLGVPAHQIAYDEF